MEGIHGGDIYRNPVTMDFSVNINPLGMPDGVEEALQRAIGQSMKYPDIMADELKQQSALCFLYQKNIYNWEMVHRRFLWQ